MLLMGSLTMRTTNALELATNILKKEEGWRPTPYYDTLRYPTVGYGFKLAGQDAPLPEFYLPKEVGEVWLKYEIQAVYERLFNRVEHLDAVRAAVLVSMCFQLGYTGLSKFKRMWAAVEASDYEEAAKEMLNSLWARQTPERAERQAEMMRTGRMLRFYG